MFNAVFAVQFISVSQLSFHTCIYLLYMGINHTPIIAKMKCNSQNSAVARWDIMIADAKNNIG